MHRIWFRLELRPRPRCRSSQCSSRLLCCILGGPTSKGREGEEKGRAREKRR